MGKVTVLTGPARCGKTERLLTRYRRVLAERTPGQVLWIAPTSRGVTAIRERLLRGDLAACFRPGVVTFDGFAEAVLGKSRERIYPISSQQKRSLVRSLLRQAQQQGKLRHFAPIADSAGLTDLVCEFIRELKRLEVWPEDFAAACRSRGMQAKDREFLALYTRYQETLLQHQLYDREGRFWTARRLLKEGQKPPFEWLRLVVVDGFSDFTRTQHEILEVLASRDLELVITLPLESDPVRRDLFAKPLATLEQLKKRHDEIEVQAVLRPAEPSWPTLGHLERQLFRPPREAEPIAAPAGVEIVAASRQVGEIQTIARRIKRLLLDEEASPTEIAVVFRSLGDVAPLVRETFREMGIPLAIETNRRLGEAPALAALLRFLRLQTDDWPFRRLLAMLTSNYFAPNWPQLREGRAVVAAERIIRTLQVPRGRDELLSQVERLAQQKNDQAVVAKLALPLFKRLAECFDRLPRRAAPSEWGRALTTFAEELGILKNEEASGEITSEAVRLAWETDQLGWQRLQRLIVQADHARKWLGSETAKFDLTAIFELIEDLLALETLNEKCNVTGCVRVLGAESVRTLDVPFLFFAGLSERAFPAAERSSQLYSEAEMAGLKSERVPFIDRQERNCEEMLLFYEVMTRASRRLVLSFPALDESAHPHSPSSYLLEVERAAGENVIPRQLEVHLSPVPADGLPLGPADLRTLAVAQACEGKGGLLSNVLHTASSHALRQQLQAALRVNLSRQQGDSFGPFEGVFDSSAAGQELLEKFGPDHAWSPSRLEGYAYCPFQFFADQVLRIAPLDELTLETDYLSRGGILHDVLAQVHRQLNDELGRPASPGEVSEEEFLRRFESALQTEIAARGARGLEGALREIDRRTLLDWAGGYYQQHEKYDKKFQNLSPGCRPAHFEVRFGPRRDTDDSWEDPLSRDEPLELAIDGETLKIIGRIDRIDTALHEGQLVFNLLDYKSGRSQSLKHEMVREGTALQLPLYALAAKELLAELAAENNSESANPWLAAYWYVRDGGTKSSFQFGRLAADLIEPAPEWDAIQQHARERVGEIVAGMRRGEFPMSCRDEQCTSRCDFRTVCRVNQVRSLEKQWPPDAEPAAEEPN